MNLKPIRRYRRRLNVTSGILKNNPVLAMGLALPFAIVPTLSLKNGVAISAVMLAATLPAALAASLMGRKIALWLRVPLCCLISMLFVLLSRTVLLRFPVVLEDLGIYVPLTAVNTMLLHLISEPEPSLRRTLGEAARLWVGFALVVCSISALREILGGRTIWGVEFALYPIKMSGVTLPFFGFILLGFLSALFRSVDRAVIRGMLSRQTVRERTGKTE